MNVESQSTGAQTQARGANITDTVVDTIVRWPIRMTGATMDLVLQGVQRMAGATRDGMGVGGSSTGTTREATSSTSSGSRWTSLFTGSAMLDQDLSGDDLKYVIWSIVFTKPGYECILQDQQEELVSYPADGNTYAAVKIAKFLDAARHGHARKPTAWADRYPGDSSNARSGRDEVTIVTTTPGSTTASVSSSGKSGAQTSAADTGWRIPPEDQKSIVFLYKVDRRLPRQEEVTRVDRITVERGARP